jgi:UPF0716 family protein affecting phage T7 exclusion
MAVAGGLCLIHPGIITDAVGIVLIATVLTLQLLRRRRALTGQDKGITTNGA